MGAIGPVDADTVFIVMILYRSEDSIPSFIDCLHRQETPNWRLVVIDNQSPDNSLAVLSGLVDERTTIVRNVANLGFAKAANQGLVAAAEMGGTFFVLMNNDVSFEPDFLQRFAAARRALQAEVITPRIMHMETPDQAWYSGGEFAPGWLFEVHHGAYEPEADPAPRTVEFATGCCLGLTRSGLERAGLLDESYFVYWEDVDFCFRLRQLGLPIVYVPELSLQHAVASASGGAETPSHLRLYYRGYMQFLRRHFGYGHALRSMYRVLVQQSRHRSAAQMRAVTTALLLGLTAPLRAVPHLPSGSPSRP